MWRLLRKLTVELPYDPVIVLLGIDPKNTITVTQRDTVNPMLTAEPYFLQPHGGNSPPAHRSRKGKEEVGGRCGM